MKDEYLYHGSRGGIKGEIAPISRERCDFGKGFYMGSNPEQAKMITCDKRNPYMYQLKFRLSGLDKILSKLEEHFVYGDDFECNFYLEYDVLTENSSIIFSPTFFNKDAEKMFNELSYQLDGRCKCDGSVSLTEDESRILSNLFKKAYVDYIIEQKEAYEKKSEKQIERD